MIDQLVTAWDAAGLGPRIVRAGDGSLVVLRRGARAAPFDERGRPLLWLAPSVLPGGDVAAWAARGAWDFGSERLWIGPEIRFMVSDRADFDGSYSLPAAMDPGTWRLEARGEKVGFEQELELVAHHPAGRVRLHVEQRLAPAPDPIRRELRPAGVRHMGWAREVTLRRAVDDERSVACQAWVLIQAHAGGKVLVPGAGAARLTDYFEPIDPQHAQRHGTDLTLSLSGTRRYKVGVRTGEHQGRAAYWRELPGGEALLVVRTFLDSPSTRYLEEPPGAVGHEGDSLYFYNDDGRNGAFGEVEALGRALEPDADSVTDLFELHMWWGKRSQVAQVAGRATGSAYVF